jgi:hypothetical protein
MVNNGVKDRNYDSGTLGPCSNHWIEVVDPPRDATFINRLALSPIKSSRASLITVGRHVIMYILELSPVPLRFATKYATHHAGTVRRMQICVVMTHPSIVHVNSREHVALLVLFLLTNLRILGGPIPKGKMARGKRLVSVP